MSHKQIDPREFLEDFYRAGDALQASTWLTEYWTADAELEFCGQPAIKGSQAIETFFAARFAELASMKHTIRSADMVGRKIYHEAEVSYQVIGDGQSVALRAMTVFGLSEDGTKITFSHSYMDPTPLKERKLLVQRGTE